MRERRGGKFVEGRKGCLETPKAAHEGVMKLQVVKGSNNTTTTITK